VLTDSTFSPAGTPYPHPTALAYSYNPFIQTNGNLVGLDQSMSMRSSPSHIPVVIPPGNGVGTKRLKRKGKLSTGAMAGTGSTEPLVVKPKATVAKRGGETVASTEIPETTDDEGEVEPPIGGMGDETEDYGGMVASQFLAHHGILTDNETINGIEDDVEWVDGGVNQLDDVLALEFHPSYVADPMRRNKVWDEKWEHLKDAFNALDRSTDGTVLLLASSPSNPKIHRTLCSRSLRRSPELRLSAEMAQLRYSFASLVRSRQHIQRQARQLNPDPSASSEELREALHGALGSLHQLGKMYSDLEERWMGEMRRLGEEKESVEVILRQALGYQGVVSNAGTSASHNGPMASPSQSLI